MFDDAPRTGKFSDNSRYCVRLINQYWLSKGYVAGARIELRKTTQKTSQGEVVYWHNEIVSDTINGMPLYQIQKN